MTKDEMRQKVAKACGWKPRVACAGYYRDDCEFWRRTLPDYPNDLNACRKMEEALIPSERVAYGERLALACGYADDYYSGWGVNGLSFWEIAHCTAEQRCEAFLRVKGLWEE